MLAEGIATVPRKDRPDPESLEGYERNHNEPEPDYTLYRRELSDWLYDYRREEEEKREQAASGRQTLPGHETNDYLMDGNRRGFSPDDFDLNRVVRTIDSRPQH